MLELVNLSNYKCDLELIRYSADCLKMFLNKHRLDGIEMMFYEPWDMGIHKKAWIYGAHLRFWPCWLDFWREDREALLEQFGCEEKIREYYGGLTREALLAGYRADICTARQAGAKYLVFHVSHARTEELFSWQFSASDREVIEATIQVVNELAGEIPADMALLFENLWWPGLTLKDRELAEMLLENVNHSNVGIMLDTGHLMNTNHQLRTDADAVDYILRTVSRLGKAGGLIKGIHLHSSLANGHADAYIKKCKARCRREYAAEEVLSHVLELDAHLPFQIPDVRRIVDYIQPDYLVHEFLQDSLEDWARKVGLQQSALYGDSRTARVSG